tara:strand:- start:554 stop:1117 length:564 start_codon:yes stop_codon:yes gene_type:complete
MLNKTYNWGPLVYATKINNEENKTLLNSVIKNNSTYTKELANTVAEEYPFDPTIFTETLKHYFKSFLDYYCFWYNVKEKPQLKLTHSWINFMKKGEFVPMHDHEADFSSVLYLKVNTIKGHEHFKEKFAGPGAIIFKYGEKRKHNIDRIIVQPEKNDFIIFPSNLTHFVYPFESDEERICIASNYVF